MCTVVDLLCKVSPASPSAFLKSPLGSKDSRRLNLSLCCWSKRAAPFYSSRHKVKIINDGLKHVVVEPPGNMGNPWQT